MITAEEFGKFYADRFNEISERFRAHLDTVPEEYREAVVEDFLDQLVKHGWIKKEFRDNIGYNKDYKGDK